MNKPTYQKRGSRTFVVANDRIRYKEVRVLTADGEQLGVMPTREAVEKARLAGQDLVLITENAKPPVTKIIEIAKYKYQQQQKEAENRKRAKKQDIKEVRFTPFMSDGDFNSRLKKVITFLERGDKVRLSLLFKGRAILKKEFGYDMFARVVEATTELATIEIEPKLMGKKLIAQLSPSKTKEK